MHFSAMMPCQYKIYMLMSIIFRKLATKNIVKIYDNKL